MPLAGSLRLIHSSARGTLRPARCIVGGSLFDRNRPGPGLAGLPLVGRPSPLRRRTRRTESRAAFSMIELMVVVSMILVLTAIGYDYGSDLLPRYRTRQAAMDFANYVGECRALAITKGMPCRVLLVSFDNDLDILGSNQGSYVVQSQTSSGAWDTLPLDLGTTGVDLQAGTTTVDLASGQTRLRHVSIKQWASIGGSGAGNANALVFDSRGFLSNPPDDFQNGKISVTFVNKVAREKGVTDEWTVQVTRAGLAQIDAAMRGTDDNFTNAGGTATSTTYDPAGPFGSP